MRPSSSSLCAAAAALLMGTALACSSDNVTDFSAPPALALELTPAVDTIFVTDSAGFATREQLTLTATSFNLPVATPSGVEWSTDNAAVAVVDSAGGVHPTGVGTATITARVNDAKAHATVVVAYAVNRVVVTPGTLNVLAGDTVQITATALDANGVPVPGTIYTFTPLDPTTASVTRTGNTTARALFLKAGAARIDVRADDQVGSAIGTVQAKQFISAPAAGAPSGALVMDAGEDATCGLLPFGRGYCFGREGLLGVAKDTSCFNDSGPSEACTLVPLRIAGSLNLTSLSVGGSVACATSGDKHIYCWGDQTYGQLGNGVSATGTSVVPTLVLGPSGTSFVAVSAGGTHACALDVSGKAYCWGQDSVYQLGNGERFRVNSTTPIPVSGGLNFAMITAGGRHTCALTDDGSAYCWGSNARGQVAAGNVGDTLDIPALIAGGTKFTMLSAGESHTCGITTAGAALCWGANDSGQLGNNSTADSNSPVAVTGGLLFKFISAGRSNTCGVTTAGAVYCWGANGYGQIGNGSLDAGPFKSPTAVQPVAGVTFAAVAVGYRHACAVGANAAYCWGSNVFGALGNELQAMKQPTPQRIATPQF